MDLERIKQNLRLRSGRLKKKSRKEPRPAPPRAVQTSQYTQTDADTATLPDGRADSSERPTDEEEKTTDAVLPPEETQEQDTAERESVQRHESGTEVPEKEKGTDHSVPSPPSGRQDTQTREEMPADTTEKGDAPPRRQPLSRQSTAKSDSASQKPTPQLLSSLMAHSSDSESDSESSTDSNDFDLRPPAPKPKPPSVESTSELLFSAGHLNTLLYHPPLLARFTSFLHRYSPEHYPLLMRYLETSKAIAAVEYANAVVNSAPELPDVQSETKTAASFDKAFETAYNASFTALLQHALPLYTTYGLVKIVSDCLQNEITGKATPMMRSLTGGLSEVFCLTDPNQKDNPIIYASEEFYRYTGFGRDDVIGHNCRFLQGSKTRKESVGRLSSCLHKGEEVCEALLNYRRDGRPFINLLMIAPLHNDKGDVKYHIGAQVDVSGLVEGGRGLEGFRRYLEKRENDRQRDEREARRFRDEEAKRKQKTLAKLRDLSELFDLEESAVVATHSRSNSTDREEDAQSTGGRPRSSRKILISSDVSDDEDDERPAIEEEEAANAWELGDAGPQGLSGKLPGVYEKYMLVRPAPSLRTIFVSPKLRSYGKLVQSPFLAHVAAPTSTLDGLAESFKQGTPVSARINFLPKRGERREGTKINPGSRHEDGKYGRACWISATPLLDSNDQVGVWMIVFVERLRGRDQPERYRQHRQGVFGRTISDSENQTMARRLVRQHSRTKSQDIPIKPVRIDAGEKPEAFVGYRHLTTAPVIEEQSSNGSVFEEASGGGSYEKYVVPPQPARQNGSRDKRQSVVSQSPASMSSNRKRYGTDSDDERGEEIGKKSDSESRTGSPFPDFLSPNVPASVPSDALSPSSEQLDSKTPTRPTFGDIDITVDSSTTVREKSASSSPRILSPRKSHGSPSSGKGKKHSDKLHGDAPKYMDYLSHPGSNRALQGQATERGRTKVKYGENDSDAVTDIDCVRSPYSID